MSRHYADMVGPCFFGGCLDLCTETRFDLTSPNGGTPGDIGAITKQPAKGFCDACIQCLSFFLRLASSCPPSWYSFSFSFCSSVRLLSHVLVGGCTSCFLSVWGVDKLNLDELKSTRQLGWVIRLHSPCLPFARRATDYNVLYTHVRTSPPQRPHRCGQL